MKAASLLFVLCLAFSGCTTHAISGREDFNGLRTPYGEPIAHIHTARIGVHTLFGTVPAIGVITLPETIKRLTEKAKELGGTEIRITNSDQTAWWAVFPPLSFLVTPKTTSVSADVYANPAGGAAAAAVNRPVS